MTGHYPGDDLPLSEVVGKSETIRPEWDVFICHASEDKETVADPLTAALAKCGLRVWIDKQQLQVGNSLRRKIDDGLRRSRHGIVVLSPHFFAKEWPQKELDTLVSMEDRGENVVLPVWHEVSKSDVAGFSPLLADRYAVSTAKGLDVVVEGICKAVKRDEIGTPMKEPAGVRPTGVLRARMTRKDGTVEDVGDLDR